MRLARIEALIHPKDTERKNLIEALRRAVGALKCNETFHRLGGIDDCEPCFALAEVDKIMAGGK
jgi:hypothetical protein